MADPTRTETRRRVRRWVDHDLATQRRPLSIFGPLFLVAFLMLGGHWMGGFTLAIWAIVASLYVAWTGFVVWRIVRLVRAASIRGDREFDQRGKYLLSTEYHRSESVLAAGRRKRRKTRR